MHSNGTPIDSYVIISWHNPKSLTWRWSLSYEKYSKDCKFGLHCSRTYRYKGGINGMVLINLPMIGRWAFNMQPSMSLNKIKGVK